MATLSATIQDAESTQSADGLSKVLASLDACKGLQMDAPYAQGLHDFRGRMHAQICIFVSAAGAKTPQQDTFFTKALEIGSAIQQFDAVKELGVTDITQDLIDLAQTILSAAGTLAQIQALSDDASDKEKRELGISALSCQSRLTGLLDKEGMPSDAHHWHTLVQFGVGFVRDQREFLTKFVQDSRKVALSEVVLARNRLDKVGGGLSNGGVWKKDLSGGERLDSEPMVQALRTFSGLYAAAILKRAGELKEASSQCQPRPPLYLFAGCRFPLFSIQTSIFKSQI